MASALSNQRTGAALHKLLRLPTPLRQRTFSVLNRPQPNYPGHVPLNFIERGALAIGSAFGSLIDPYRHDLIASLGEATTGGGG